MRMTAKVARRPSDNVATPISAIESAPVMVRDLDGTVRHWTRGLEDIYGWSSDEARGHVAHDLLQTTFSRAPEEIERDLFRNGAVALELRQRHKNGKVLLVASRWTLYRDGHGVPEGIVETNIDISPLVRKPNDIEERYRNLINLGPLHSEGGVVVSAAIRDLSARKHAEDLLIQSEAAAHRHAELFQTIATSMVQAVMLIDEAAHLVYANPAALAFLGNRAHTGSGEWQAMFEHLGTEGGNPIAHEDWPMMRALRGEAIDKAELVLRPDASTVCYIVVTSRPIRDKSGHVSGALVMLRDVTDARETERELRQSQKMDAIGQLTGGIAHDFNNILTVITGTIDILADGVSDRPTLAAVARMIEEAAARGAALTRHLLAVARKQPLQPSATDVNALAMDTIQLLQPALGPRTEIEPKLDAHAWPAMVDASQLSTAIINLAVNARDAMPEGGKVTLTTANAVLDEAYVRDKRDVKPGAYLMIAVGDHGTGIPATIRDKVLEPFFTTKTRGKGTGLGLSMVYGFVKQSGGHLELVSEEGRGTTVKLFLPRANDEAGS
jgi:PAS domain S-box-containing protein